MRNSDKVTLTLGQLKRLIKESSDDEWCVVRTGGSIGVKFTHRVGGTPCIVQKDGLTKDEAKNAAKTFRSFLSPDERKYYRYSYKAVPKSALKSNVSESEEEHGDEPSGNGNYVELFNYGAKLLQVATEVHLWHLNTRNNAAHQALKDLYEDLTDHADKLLEAVIGQTNHSIENNRDNPEYKFGDLDFDAHKDDYLSELKARRDEAEELVGKSTEGIDNILGDICELFEEAIYKLKRLS